jgi:hypothetical protein
MTPTRWRPLWLPGVRGKRRSTRECAVAVYVAAVVGADDRVSTLTVDDTRLRITLLSQWTPPVVVWLPPAVRQLISAVDGGRFPFHVRAPALLPATGRTENQQLTASGRERLLRAIGVDCQSRRHDER